MPLKDILVHIDSTPQCRHRLEAAIALAVAHDAHLVGLYVLYHPEIPPYIRLQMGEDVLSLARANAEADAKNAHALFEELTQRSLVKSEWRCIDGKPLPVLSLHARYTDVAIVGQRDPSGESGADDAGMPDQLILSIGRPVLVVPFVGAYPVIGEQVMVAWDGSRLATRAVNDALPILTQAKKVMVIAVNPSTENEGAHGEIPSADICLHLARHGVNAEAQQVYADDLGVGEMLLSRATDEGCDLMVIGAYGHARWRELVLGGVTRHMLMHMTLPVLMSH